MPYLLFDENGTLNYIRLTRGFLLTLGCTPDCNIVLPPGNCPHFRIADCDGNWFFEDLASVAPGSRTPLANGDRISLHDLTIRFLDSVEGLGAKPFPGVLALSAGQKIGKYTVVSQTGKTEHGRFYQLSDFNSKPFGLKVYNKNTTEEERALFKRETDALLACSLPDSLAPYHGFGSINANCYYVTDYYEHPNLAFRISSKAPMPQLDALNVVYDIAEILRDAFRATGTFHGSLMPSNVLYDAEDRMRLAEFGMFYWKSVVLTGGHPCVSPWYISPEAVSGDEMSMQSDMYALGVMLFQMLTGVLPFHSFDERELFQKHLLSPFPLPAERNPNVSVSAGTIQLLLRLSAKDPAGRFPDWDSLLKALDYAASSRLVRTSANAAVRAAADSNMKSTLRLKSKIL